MRRPGPAALVAAALLGPSCVSTQITHWTGLDVSSAVREFGPPTRVASVGDCDRTLALFATRHGYTIPPESPCSVYDWDVTRRGPGGEHLGVLVLQNWTLDVDRGGMVLGMVASTELPPGSEIPLADVVGELGQATIVLPSLACAGSGPASGVGSPRAAGSVVRWVSTVTEPRGRLRYSYLGWQFSQWTAYVDRDGKVMGWKLVESTNRAWVESDPGPRMLCPAR